ncbi:hypothetical protein, partial [Helicobacter mesocricetorum]|uniref:hypothetical protein n=1 Tax=Helicobacter mesocricetorum TaxID=87012 RepID=UPI00131506FF
MQPTNNVINIRGGGPIMPSLVATPPSLSSVKIDSNLLESTIHTQTLEIDTKLDSNLYCKVDSNL